ncbi:peptide chain release factor 1 [Spirochaeta lutea]|uniref:Peptide chain release factor 1 n=1 Tax=Spirochaeta lutea TaxID=1480694 RepID=A0A098R377_9SPIO|nr:peptide chain release factor 1 [Spirochaeta lutea]KGE73182.1 peptide chain release factor 1 [Spirochaeta lutea]
MIEKLETMAGRFKALEEKMMDPDLPKDPKRYKEVMMEHNHLSEIVEAYTAYKEVLQGIEDARVMLQEQDSELREMAREELDGLEGKKEGLEADLRLLLIPKDPLDGKNAIMEIRAGTGGDEASLFAGDLYRMYSRYAETMSWKIEVMTAHETEVGGLKEIILSISGKDVFGTLKYESGGHRVQRVPTTESGGRIHTSACTVAVLPEAEETDIAIEEKDLRIDVFRSSGPGGQSVNTTDSAVRVTHIPTGLVVSCQDEKSQHKNKAKALRVLKARLYELEESKRQAELSAQRKSMIGSGDRSERIRTYNFPQNRLTDHRINLTLYRLDQIMQGDLSEIIETLRMTDREEALQSQEG